MNQQSSFDITGIPVAEFARTAWDVPEDFPATEVASMVARSPQRTVLVTEPRSKRLRGIITVDDLDKLNISPSPTRAGQLATVDQVIAASGRTSVGDALQIMYGRNSIHEPLEVLPVVNDRQEIMGIVTRKDLEDQLLRSQTRSQSSSLSY